MAFAEYDQVVDALPSNHADYSLRVPILPGRPWRNRPVPNAHSAEPSSDCSTIERIPVPDQVAWGLIPRKGFGNLQRNPLCRGMPRDIDPDKLAPSQPDNHQNIS